MSLPPRGLRDTHGADSPINHFRFINAETCRVGSGQARRFTDGAVDIDRLSTGATDRVVVVVADPILIERRRPCRLDASEDALFDQGPKGVVHGLSGDHVNLGANFLRDGVCRGVGSTGQCAQHRQTLGRDGQAVLSKDLSGVKLQCVVG